MKYLVDKVSIAVTPLNPRWQGFGGITPVCKCGASMAQRFDDKPWRCWRGHFIRAPRYS